ALRGRYWGNRAYTPMNGILFACCPSPMWQLTQRSLLPTWAGRLSRVLERMARPRRTAASTIVSLISDSAGTRNGTGLLARVASAAAARTSGRVLALSVDTRGASWREHASAPSVRHAPRKPTGRMRRLASLDREAMEE